MDIRTLQILAEYNRKVNSDMNAIIKNLPADQWNQEFKGYFNSIQSLCNHIYLADFNWLKRFSKLRKFSYMDHALFDQELPFGSMAFETVEQYLDRRKTLDEHLRTFTKEIAPEDLDAYLEYTDSQGKVNRRSFGGLVLHCFNHQTHHRGMISLYLDHMGISNDFSNLAGMV